DERHRLSGAVAELETVPASDTNVRLAGKQGQACRLRCPPPLEQLGFGPCLEYDARWGVEGSRNDELAFGLPFYRRAVRHGVGSLPLLASIDRLLPLQFLDTPVQGVEACVPELAVLLDPCRLFLQPAQAELAGPHAPDLVRGDESHLLQDEDVLLH